MIPPDTKTNKEISASNQLLQTLLMGKVKDITESDRPLLEDSNKEDYNKTEEISLINKGVIENTKEKYDDKANSEYTTDKNSKKQDVDKDKKDPTKSNNIKEENKVNAKIDNNNKKSDSNTKNLLENNNIEFLKNLSDVQQLVNIEKNLESDLEIHREKVEILRKDISDVENSLEKIYTAIGKLEKFLDLCKIEDEHIIDGLHKLVDVFNQGYSLNEDECERLFVKDCDYDFEEEAFQKRINKANKTNKIQTKNKIREENLSSNSSDDTNKYLIKDLNRYEKSSKSSVTYRKENDRHSKYSKDEINNQNSNTEDYDNNNKDKMNNRNMKLKEVYENIKMHAINPKYKEDNEMNSEKKGNAKTRVKIIKDKIARLKRSNKK
ncbi:hypothetical protein ACR3K2_12890 [Cryptosporidium serpentis]